MAKMTSADKFRAEAKARNATYRKNQRAKAKAQGYRTMGEYHAARSGRSTPASGSATKGGAKRKASSKAKRSEPKFIGQTSKSPAHNAFRKLLNNPGNSFNRSKLTPSRYVHALNRLSAEGQKGKPSMKELQTAAKKKGRLRDVRQPKEVNTKWWRLARPKWMSHPEWNAFKKANKDELERMLNRAKEIANKEGGRNWRDWNRYQGKNGRWKNAGEVDFRTSNAIAKMIDAWKPNFYTHDNIMAARQGRKLMDWGQDPQKIKESLKKMFYTAAYGPDGKVD